MIKFSVLCALVASSSFRLDGNALQWFTPPFGSLNGRWAAVCSPECSVSAEGLSGRSWSGDEAPFTGTVRSNLQASPGLHTGHATAKTPTVPMIQESWTSRQAESHGSKSSYLRKGTTRGLANTALQGTRRKASHP
jgi:hypothetical protein